jgi:hypothetical protein
LLDATAIVRRLHPNDIPLSVPVAKLGQEISLASATRALVEVKMQKAHEWIDAQDKGWCASCPTFTNESADGTSDIVERLRAYANEQGLEVRHDAADELERLDAALRDSVDENLRNESDLDERYFEQADALLEIAQLRAALSEILGYLDESYFPGANVPAARERARAALEDRRNTTFIDLLSALDVARNEWRGKAEAFPAAVKN